MSQAQKVKFYGQERLVIPDMDNLQDFVEEDFHLYNIKLFTATTKVCTGFEITDDGGLDILMGVAGAVVFNTSGTYKAFYVGDATLDPLSAEMSDGSSNYVHAQISKGTGSEAARAFWDPTLNNSIGAEFIQDVNTAEYLDVSISVNQTGFSSDPNKIPIGIVTTVGGVITAIEDSRNMFFRLGTGYPYNESYSYTLTTTTTDRTDWDSADREFETFKDWMDFVMTQIKEIKGTSTWVAPTPASLTSLKYQLTGGGVWNWHIVTAPDLSVSTPDLSVGATDFDVADNARIVAPAMVFATDGTNAGAFTVADITGLNEGQAIILRSDNGAVPDLDVVVLSVVGVTVQIASTDFDVVDNATVVNPAELFIGDGDGVGRFIVANPTTLVEDDVITLSSDLVAVPDIDVVVRLIEADTPIAGQDRITVEYAHLSYSEDAQYFILGTGFINTIKASGLVNQIPIALGDEWIAYTDLDITSTTELTVLVTHADDYVSAENRLVVARRVGNAVYIG